ncbi:MAG TPA: hypothetical protein VKQ30_03295 [Ktedonobacterales bacterium]|nr:hypothetical protein [Ktedonobacterales bacterium]
MLVLLAVIVFATIMFGIGSVVEKASAATTSTVVHQETPGGETGGAEAPAATANNQEAIFGINPESTPLIVMAIAGSIAVVAAVWFYWRRAAVLWAAGAVMTAFAVLDIVEVAHQVAEVHTTLIILAGTVAVLHLAAAVLAVSVVTSRSARQPAVVP